LRNAFFFVRNVCTSSRVKCQFQTNKKMRKVEGKYIKKEDLTTKKVRKEGIHFKFSVSLISKFSFVGS